ncbi:MAG: DUF3180 domain-containing protein [Corynebacterium sp.]|nr:DUF3180 domain-containing protein [Corynebacterium sp.]
MQRLSIPVLIAGAGFVAAATLIIVSRNYGKFASIPLLVLFTLGALALLNAGLARWVSKKIDDQAVGQDRRQLHPVTAARCLTVGQASAVTGALAAGFYGGLSTYVLPRVNDLAAARADAPRAVGATAVAIALAAAGVWLERSCTVPPPGSENPGPVGVQ